jgi:formate dehydrogenase iron-sulfur subunit
MVAKGMFVDTSLCIGCKACQVACKEWNGLSGTPERFKMVDNQLTAVNFTGNSYDNTGHLTAYDWRHVRFIENFSPDRSTAAWYMMSDSCKHCVQAGCLDVCPTHAIIRTDLGNVFVQESVCNGCRDCVAACPFGVISFNEQTGRAAKCTLCNDRIHAGLETACAKVCPTGSITFGDVPKLQAFAQQRLADLQAQGYKKAQLYGESGMLGGLNVFFLLLDDPEVYGQPRNPQLPQRNTLETSLISAGAAVVLGLSALIAFRRRETQDTLDSPVGGPDKPEMAEKKED